MTVYLASDSASRQEALRDLHSEGRAHRSVVLRVLAHTDMSSLSPTHSVRPAAGEPAKLVMLAQLDC